MMDVEYSPALPPPDSEGEDDEDATDVGVVESNDEGGFRRDEWRNEVKRTKGRGEKGNIAWLMSFPNSGTSFTSLLIRHASNATTATNYGMESHLGMDGKSVPVYDWSAEGPYWLHPPRRMEPIDDASADAMHGGYESGTKLGKSGAYDVPPASASILTKTHCGSRCTFCPPRRYLETPASFLEQCLTGSRKVAKGGDERDGDAGYEKRYHTYAPSLVARAVHLLRDPFDNLVSRFHHEQKEHAKKGKNAWSSRYSNDVFGFRRWCADEDREYAAAEREADWAAYGHPADLHRRFEGVSCHGELFRYVQWHALAMEAADALDVPVLHMYYEDYSSDLKGETGRMLDFLGLERREERLPEFDSEKDYSAFFTREERAIASDFMRRVASGGARELLERYWVELDFELLRKQTKSIK